MRTIIATTRELPNGPLPDALERQTHHPMLFTSAHTLVAILLGIVFLMITKPSLGASLLAMGLARVLGLASSIPFWLAKLRLPQQTAAHGPQAEADPFLKTTLWTRRW
jgi:hypothetical protein